MRSSESENPPAVIYLQWAPDAGDDVSWCIDQINDDDPKYVLSPGSNQNQEGDRHVNIKNRGTSAGQWPRPRVQKRTPAQKAAAKALTPENARSWAKDTIIAPEADQAQRDALSSPEDDEAVADRALTFERMTGVHLTTREKMALFDLRSHGYSVAKAGPADEPTYTLRGPGVPDEWTTDPKAVLIRSAGPYFVDEIDLLADRPTFNHADRYALEEMQTAGYRIEYAPALGYRLAEPDQPWTEGSSSDHEIRSIIDQWIVLHQEQRIVPAEHAGAYRYLIDAGWRLRQDPPEAISPGVDVQIRGGSLAQTLAIALAHQAELDQLTERPTLIDQIEAATDEGSPFIFSARRNAHGTRYTLKRADRYEVDRAMGADAYAWAGPWHAVDLQPLVDIALKGRPRTIGEKIAATHAAEAGDTEPDRGEIVETLIGSFGELAQQAETARIQLEEAAPKAAAYDQLAGLMDARWSVIFSPACNQRVVSIRKSGRGIHYATASLDHAVAVAYFADQALDLAEAVPIDPPVALELYEATKAGYDIAPPLTDKEHVDEWIASHEDGSKFTAGNPRAIAAWIRDREGWRK